jgi:phenylalanyl-tRNA synthetase alpha subunit
MKALKQYAKYYKQYKALEEIMKDLHPRVLRELKKYPDGKADFEGVEFHLTKKMERKYSDEIEDLLKELRNQINSVKQQAEESGKVTINEKETFDAQIPRSFKEEVLSTVSFYKRYFS